ncbi:MAG: ribosome-associated translation inhibitor RaiA [Dysgonamonadaceae bacterium]|jgi:putative sigma-54 modulation protein|nr:ribosome-associated translation inhibitor RaiA [Dysgonamonadaceae bacterium]MDD3308358.1 ribosome-associated translation inhibitor RaiA [Dysgonamonadaceae bacterium]MDD3900259.1 ribosome-associated translation inhibitor RaiA [Dysgonamonadaceae bacterium]MDD4398815.1 ribosome-associated translation inhibitor RaiA [Dysgonamonadaceae bacterium]MEA5080975.1 ribosome-associated translation inhibitor RaiA [Dysgonamonadaceae bacterium]
MELRISSINFDATEQLKAFTEKKMKKLEKFNDSIIDIEVALKVIKPETVKNKEASIKMNLRNREAFASKIADTFEEAIDLCSEALEKQIIKTKEKNER